MNDHFQVAKSQSDLYLTVSVYCIRLSDAFPNNVTDAPAFRTFGIPTKLSG